MKDQRAATIHPSTLEMLDEFGLVENDEDDATALSEERIEERLQKFFPKTGAYHVEYVNVYGVSQRVPATFRRGHIFSPVTAHTSITLKVGWG